MERLKFLLTKPFVKKIFILFILLASIWWAGKGIFKYNVFSTHDLDHHISRSFDAVQTFKEGHFPMRWAGSLNYYCGVPIYDFFYPLIYYLVVLINSINPDIIMALKIIDFASLFIGTIFFYLWIKVETKKEIPAIGGSLLYLYAPYRFSLIFVRGSPEFLAYAILPVVLYLYVLFLESSKEKEIGYAFLASLAGAFLAISHNFTVMFLFPILLVYLSVKSIILKINLRKAILLIGSFISSFGMSAFFIGPALLEKKYTRIGENFLFWKEHFPTFEQLIKSPWGYFYSALGTKDDGMSFMLGYAQWLVLGIALLWIIYRIFFKKKFDIWIILTFLASIATIYLILPISIPVWEKIEPLQEIQFSWRLLGIAIFTISSLFAFILDKIKSKYLLIPVYVIVVGLAFFGNRNHLLPQPISVEDIYRYEDYENLHPHRYSTTTLGDDVIAKGAKEACWFETSPVATNKEQFQYDMERGNTYGFIKFEVPKKIKGDKVIFRLGYFPGVYKLEINGDAYPYGNCDGKICVDVKSIHEGSNYASWKIVQTPTQSLFNMVSLGFILLWIILLIGIKKIKPHLLLIIIFGAFLFFRSYNLPGRTGFGWDQERDANAATKILSGDLTLIGPRVQGPAGFFLPPYFFYLIAPFYKVSNLDPIASNVFIITWSVATFFLGYFFLKKIFDKKFALIFLAIWAVNPLAVSIDTIAWNPVVIPFIFLLLLYLLYLYYNEGKTLTVFLLGLVFGIGVSFHLQFLFALPLLTPFVVEIIKKRQIKQIVYFGLGAVIPVLPLLVFDLRHNFLNFKQLMEFIKTGSTINRVFLVWERISSFMIASSATKVVGSSVYLMVSLGYLLALKKEKEKIRFNILLGLGLVWISSLPLFNLFIKNPSEYYFNYLLVPLIILISLFIRSLKQLGLLLLIVVITYFSIKAYPLLKNVNLSLREKSSAVIVLRNITLNSIEPFNVSFDVPLNEDAGFRYLLNFYKVKVSGNSQDPLIEFVIPPDPMKSTFKIDTIGLYFPSGWINRNYIR